MSMIAELVVEPGLDIGTIHHDRPGQHVQTRVFDRGQPEPLERELHRLVIAIFRHMIDFQTHRLCPAQL